MKRKRGDKLGKLKARRYVLAVDTKKFRKSLEHKLKTYYTKLEKSERNERISQSIQPTRLKEDETGNLHRPVTRNEIQRTTNQPINQSPSWKKKVFRLSCEEYSVLGAGVMALWCSMLTVRLRDHLLKVPFAASIGQLTPNFKSNFRALQCFDVHRKLIHVHITYMLFKTNNIYLQVME